MGAHRKEPANTTHTHIHTRAFACTYHAQIVNLANTAKIDVDPDNTRAIYREGGGGAIREEDEIRKRAMKGKKAHDVRDGDEEEEG